MNKKVLGKGLGAIISTSTAPVDEFEKFIEREVNMYSKKELGDFAKIYVAPIKARIKEELYTESLLRNKFQVRPLDEAEIPLYPNKYVSYVVNETGCTINKVMGGKSSEDSRGLKIPYLPISCKFVLFPLFEISCNPEIPYKDIKQLKSEEVLKKFVDKIVILQEENKYYDCLKNYTENGKGVFVIRVDLQVLIAVDTKKQIIGFSIFENVGAGVVCDKKE